MSYPPRLENKVALITGSSSGLGRAISLAYASHGTKLIVCTDLEPAVKQTAEGDPESSTEPTHELINRTYGDGKAVFVRLDVRKADDFRNAIAEAVKLGGRLDIVVNNAGVAGGAAGPPKPFHEEDESVYDFVMDINLRGVYLGTKLAVAQMLKQNPDLTSRRGWIVNIASILGLIGVRGNVGLYGSPYAASKGAVINLSRQVAVNYADQGIHCNALCPGWFRTALTNKAQQRISIDMAERQPLSGWGNAQDIAKAAVFLVSDDASFVTGIGLPVDGGYTAQ